VKYLLIVVSSLTLAACGGSLLQSKAPPTAVYLLSVSAAPGGAEVPVDLAVRKPRVRTGLDTDLIAALYPDRRLDYFAGARWSGRLDEVVQDLAVQAFRTRADLRAVRAGVSAPEGGYWLELDVADFQAEYSASPGEGGAAPTIHVHLWGQLGGPERHVLGRLDADVRMPAADNRLTAIVAAYNAAADAALAKIVADATAALKASSERR
jgi:ABC-type uncharacterized transport system auxiliary subunit